MKKHLIMVISAVCLFYSISAQQSTKQKIRYYEVWISFVDSEAVYRGILYEVNDSSVLIAGLTPLPDYPAGSEYLKEFSYSNIDIIKARRLKSVGRGTIIGVGIGAGAGLTAAVSLYGEAVIMFAGAPALVMMFPAAAFGAGAGALVGLVKDRFPIESDIDNFNLYRSSLQAYSLQQESDLGLKQFEHKGFAGFSMGFVFPLDNNLRTGPGTFGFAGYRFTNRWGIFVTQFSYQYGDNSYGDSYRWSMGGITAGPLISAPLTDRVRLDFKPGIGLSDASLWLDNDEEKSGQGLGLGFNMSLLYNFSKRGGFLAEAGYYSTSLRYSDTDTESSGFICLNIGYVYKFSRRSL
jgi:hypothetical protein